MFFKIAMCDDNVTYSEFLKEKINAILDKLQIKAEITSYENGHELIEQFESGNLSDIVILDIDMQDINGKDLAKKLRLLDAAFRLIFVSSYKEEVYNTLQYRVSAFIPKNNNELLMVEMGRVIKDVTDNVLSTQFIEIMDMYKNKSEIRIHTGNIFYFQCANREIFLYTSNAEYKLSEKKFSNLVAKFCTKGFFEVCRGSMANVEHIQEVKRNDIVLDNGVVIPMSRRNRENLLKAISNHITAEAMSHGF